MSSRNHSIPSWTLRWAVIACLLSCGCDKGKPPSTSPHRGGPIPAIEGIDDQGRLRFGEKDRCPVCAMKVKDHPKFACGIELEDGRTYYFCGTGCMIRTWLHPEVFLGVERGALRRAAETLLLQDPPLLYPSCFHSQQAAEKYLKAYLTRRQVEFPKTHSIREILDLVRTVDEELAAALLPSAALTPYGVEVRYPGDVPEPSQNETEEALALA